MTEQERMHVRDGAWYRRIYIALGLLAVMLLAARVWAVQAELSRPYGRYSTRQILDRAEPICRTFAPREARLRLRADKTVTYDQGRAPHHQWCVACGDDTGMPVAFLVWNADTGNLLTISHRTPFAGESGRPISSRKALTAARDWLRILGLAGLGPWRPTSPPKQVGGSWLLSGRAGNHAVTVRVEAHSGDLIYLRNRVLPTA